MISATKRRGLVWLALVAAVGIALTVGISLSMWQLQGRAAAEASLPVVTASRDDVIVSVGGVGRIVEARAPAQLVLPAGVGGGAAAGGALVPAGAVFPRASGHVLRLLVRPGQRVAAGQPLARLDDGGSAAAAIMQAEGDLATALLELRQRQIGRPGPTAAELAAGRLAVTSARLRLARVLGSPRRADVSAAQLDVKRGEADLQTLLGGTPASRAEAIRIAQHNVQLAEKRLDQVLAPPSPADLSAAEAEVKKAEADLATLLKPPSSPLPEALVAAQQAATVAQQNLATVQASGDPAAVGAAQLELDKALAELAGLQQPAPAPLPEEIAAAKTAIDTARRKLALLFEPPNPADVETARLELERAQADLRTLEAGPSPAALAAARQAVDSPRARLAQVLGPPLPADVAAAQLDVRRAEADLAMLGARGGSASSIEIALARQKIKAAQGRLAFARAAKRLLTVRASSGGTVTALLTARGAPVDPSTPIAAVADLDRLAVGVDLSEFDVARVRRGLPAVVSVDALGGKSFPGKVLFVALTGTDAGGVVTFPVRVGLARAVGRAGGLKPGMNVSVRIIVAERRDVVQVPLEAVARDDSERPIVTLIDAAGQTSLRRVKLGLASNKSVEIVTGLLPGQRVVLAESLGQGEGEEGE